MCCHYLLQFHRYMKCDDFGLAMNKIRGHRHWCSTLIEDSTLLDPRHCRIEFHH